MAELTYAQALNAALHEEMARDPAVWVLGEDIAAGRGGIFGVTRGLLDRFGAERVRNTPLSEEIIVGTAVGAAVTGTRPVAELMYLDFVGLAMDQLVNQAAKLRYMFGGKARVPMVLRAQEGAGRGNAAQHSQSLEAWFVHIPGLKVVVPSTPEDAKGLLKTAIRDDNPTIFLEHKVLYFAKGEVPESDDTIPFGQAAVRRRGDDVTYVGIHTMVQRGLTAAEILEREDEVSMEVIDPRTLVPLDLDTIVESVKRTGRLVIGHEAYERGGIAGEIAMQVTERAFDYLDAPVVRVAGKNVPIPYNVNLERAAIPQEADLVAAVRRLF
ncbi:MAG TPA: alpha-ketoacid dehydrogenase subunit beta [Chloroflexota bacterium]|jgi:pyruvate dehydrogenase E1 component beta subunit